MNKKLITLAVAGALTTPIFAGTAVAADSPHSFSGNVGVVTDYLFRGISQTHGNAALQGGFDYGHSSGFYAGIWGSSISWVSDAQNGSTPTEIDIYGGYRGSITGDIGYDLGLIAYNYPGDGRTPGAVNPDTTEIYGALSWKWLTLKYSHATSSHFVAWTTTANAANGSTKGSSYLELNASYDIGDGWGINGHLGHQKVKGNGPASYSDWKVGVTKDVGFGVVGLSYSDTNANGGSCAATGATGTYQYCWGTNAGTTNFEDVAKGTAVLSFSKSF